ncbi:MAG: alpha/beta fold hydrolase [Planktomarina sp.]
MGNNVKTILVLPGLDGTGKLLDDFAAELADDFDVRVVSYTFDQTDYDTIFDYVKSLVPERDYIVVGESFSGPLAGMFADAKPKHLKGVVFAATFLSRPSIWPAWCMTLLWAVPFQRKFFLNLIHPMFMGFRPGKKLFDTFLHIMQTVPKATLIARLKTVHKLPRKPYSTHTGLPSLFLCARREWFLSRKSGDFLAHVAHQTCILDTPHFLLQKHPKQAANHIRQFIDQL